MVILMKKKFNFFLLVSGFFLTLSSCYASDDLQFEMELGEDFSRLNLNKNEVLDSFVKDFNEIYKEEAQSYPILRILEDIVPSSDWVREVFSNFIEFYGCNSSIVPDYYETLRNLIRDSSVAIIKSKEYHQGDIELYTLVEKLVPVGHAMNGKTATSENLERLS